MEALLGQSRPRLLRYARSRSALAENAEDIVQETLLEAWRHSDKLRSPERFDAWLTGICHNVCLRWNQSQHIASQRYLPLLPQADQWTADEAPDSFDPAENLQRQDLAILLDRALGHLSPDARSSLKLFYQEEVPQEEIAERLGITTGTLKVRMHRARQQLWQVFNHQLRSDAEEFGLCLINAEEGRWRPTSIWCILCGKSKMEGWLTAQADGHTELRLRCPHCMPGDQKGIDNFSTSGIIQLGNVQSFRPAFKRLFQEAKKIHLPENASESYPCPFCKRKHTLRNAPLLTPVEPPYYDRLHVRVRCSHCGHAIASFVTSPFLSHPQVVQFMKDNARVITESERFVSYAGSDAVELKLADVLNGHTLSLFIHPQHLHIMGTVER